MTFSLTRLCMKVNIGAGILTGNLVTKIGFLKTKYKKQRLHFYIIFISLMLHDGQYNDATTTVRSLELQLYIFASNF